MKKQKAFTLVELLIVIAIFALIANVTMISLNKAKRESRDAKRMDNINQIRAALHLYSVDKLAYPDDGGSPAALGTGDFNLLDTNGWTDGSAPESPIFMYSVPRDPKMINASAPDPCQTGDTDVCDYSYELNGNDYIIFFYLEGSVGSMEGGLHFATKDEMR